MLSLNEDFPWGKNLNTMSHNELAFISVTSDWSNSVLFPVKKPVAVIDLRCPRGAAHEMEAWSGRHTFSMRMWNHWVFIQRHTALTESLDHQPYLEISTGHVTVGVGELHTFSFQTRSHQEWVYSVHTSDLKPLVRSWHNPTEVSEMIDVVMVLSLSRCFSVPD